MEIDCYSTPRDIGLKVPSPIVYHSHIHTRGLLSFLYTRFSFLSLWYTHSSVLTIGVPHRFFCCICISHISKIAIGLYTHIIFRFNSVTPSFLSWFIAVEFFFGVGCSLHQPKITIEKHTPTWEQICFSGWTKD